MKTKLVLTCLFTISLLLNGNLLFAELEVGEPDDSYEQEADRVADQVIRRPKPDMMPDPTGKIGEGMNTRSTGGDSRSMGRVPGGTPGGPVMKPGAILKSQGVRSEGRSPGVGPAGLVQQRIKGGGNVKFDGVDGESKVAGQGGRAGMPGALQQRQLIQQKLTALGFEVALIIPAGQDKWKVKVQQFDESKASPSLRGSIYPGSGIAAVDSGDGKVGTVAIDPGPGPGGRKFAVDPASWPWPHPSTKQVGQAVSGDATLKIGFTNTGTMTIGASGLSSAGFKANASKLQANGIMLQ
jgi:hypothetical protein